MSFVGDAMVTVVRGVEEVRAAIGRSPVVVGGLAVMCRLTMPYRATTDLDVIDRLLGGSPHLEVLRATSGAEPVEPSAVLLPTPDGPVRVDVLQVRQAEIDRPSADPGDRLHASAHAWAYDTATEVTIEVVRVRGDPVRVATLVAEPGPLVAMKLQAVMNRAAAKQGTDLHDVVRLVLDESARTAAVEQIGRCDGARSADIARHVDLWLVRRRQQALRLIDATGGSDLGRDDIDLVAELLLDACQRG